MVVSILKKAVVGELRGIEIVDFDTNLKPLRTVQPDSGAASSGHQVKPQADL